MLINWLGLKGLSKTMDSSGNIYYPSTVMRKAWYPYHLGRIIEKSAVQKMWNIGIATKHFFYLSKEIRAPLYRLKSGNLYLILISIWS